MVKHLSVFVLLFFLILLPLQAQQATSAASAGVNNSSSVANVLSPSSPLQQGFVVITPTSGTGGGLVAFETVGDLQNSNFQTAVLTATTLTANGSVVVDLSTGANSLTGPLSSLTNPAIAAATAGATSNPVVTSTGAAATLSGVGPMMPLFSNTGIAVINPNNTTAIVSVSLNSPGGAVINLPSLSIGPMQQVSKFVNELMGNSAAIPLPVVGVLNFASDTPIAITALQFRGTSFATVPVVNVSTVNGTTSTTVVNNGSTPCSPFSLSACSTSGTTSTGTTISPFPHLSSGIGGNGALLLPQFVMGAGWASRIVIANVSNTQQTVRIDFFSSDGSPLSTTLNMQSGSTFMNLAIPVKGAIDLGPQDVNGQRIF